MDSKLIRNIKIYNLVDLGYSEMKIHRFYERHKDSEIPMEIIYQHFGMSLEAQKKH